MKAKPSVPATAATAVSAAPTGVIDPMSARAALPMPPNESLIWPPCCSSTRNRFPPPANCVAMSVNCAGSVRRCGCRLRRGYADEAQVVRCLLERRRGGLVRLAGLGKPGDQGPVDPSLMPFVCASNLRYSARERVSAAISRSTDATKRFDAASIWSAPLPARRQGRPRMLRCGRQQERRCAHALRSGLQSAEFRGKARPIGLDRENATPDDITRHAHTSLRCISSSAAPRARAGP